MLHGGNELFGKMPVRDQDEADHEITCAPIRGPS
jgi:hypothetical protein